MSGAVLIASTLGGGYVVKLSGEDVSDTQSSPATAMSTITVRSNGTVEKTENTTTTQVDASTDWVRPASLASSAFEVMATVNSGAVQSGTTGSWLNLGSNRAWSCTRNVNGTASANLTIAIRHNGGAVISSNTYTLSATQNP